MPNESTDAQPRLRWSKPFPNQLVERYERQVELIVEHAREKKGGYVRGLVPEARKEFIKQYVQYRLLSGWKFQTEMYKGAAVDAEQKAKEKSLEDLVQTEKPLDVNAPAIGLGEL
jgi:hypothetical protein